MTTPRYQQHGQARPPRNGWSELAHWLFTSRWGVRTLLLITAAIVMAVYWQAILNLAFTALTISLVVAITWALIPKKAKKRL